MIMLSTTPKAIMTMVRPAIVNVPTQTPMTISPGMLPANDTPPTLKRGSDVLTEAASGSASLQTTLAPSWWPAKAPRVATTMKATLAKNGMNARRNPGPTKDHAAAQRWRIEGADIGRVCGKPGESGTDKSDKRAFVSFGSSPGDRFSGIEGFRHGEA